VEALPGIEHICEAEEIELVRTTAVVQDEEAFGLAGGGTFPVGQPRRHMAILRVAIIDSVHGSYDGEALVSERLPRLRIRPAATYGYRGAVELSIRGIALATRHHFVVLDDNVVDRLLVVQFEHFMTPDGRYDYELPEPVELGGETYGRWAFELSVAEQRSANPDMEMAATASHLERHGLELPDRHAVGRYARIVGEDPQYEVLLFFHECGPGALLDGILERAAEAFSVD